LSLPRQGPGAFQITVYDSRFRLAHKLADLIDHVLLGRTELPPGDLLEIRVRRAQHLIGSV
jgi:hypothetical protein